LKTGPHEKRAPGVDTVSIERFTDDEKNNLYRQWYGMSSGSYFPGPMRAVEIRVVGNVEQHAPLRSGGGWNGQPVIGVKRGVRSHMDVLSPCGRRREDAHSRVDASNRSANVIDERN